MFADGLTNVFARLGFGKAEAGRYTTTHNADQYNALYASSWVAKKAIDLPVDDACRKWRKWNGDDALVKTLEAEEERVRLVPHIKDALKQARLHGTAAVFIGTNVNVLSRPLLPTEKITFLNVLNNTEFVAEEIQASKLKLSSVTEFYRIDGVLVHASRLIIFGNGTSSIQAAFDAIRNSDSVAANVAELIYEAKLDVYKVPELLSQDDELLFKRLLLANQAKSVVNGILLDAEESYEQKQINFAGLRDILFASYQIVAGAVNIPAAKLLGTSVSGLNATGDNEVHDYDDLVQSLQADIELAMVNIDALICNAAGAPNADYAWQPLRNPTEKEVAEIKKLNADTLAVLANLQIYSDDQLLQAGQKLLGELIAEESDNVY